MMSDSDFFWFFVVPLVMGFATALLLFFGVPWLWGVLKPLLHAVTA